MLLARFLHRRVLITAVILSIIGLVSALKKPKSFEQEAQHDFDKIKQCVLNIYNALRFGALLKEGGVKKQEDCFGFLLSKGLSYMILLGSGVIKVFQIVPILNSQSVAGLDVRSLYAELVLGISSGLYNFHSGTPFSTYGETVFIFIQNLVLVYLIWTYASPAIPTASRVIATLVVGAFAAAGYHFKEYKDLLPKLTLPLLIAMRIPQIWSNFKNGHTGQLSVMTTFLGLGGSLARVFTTIKELGYEDPQLLVHGIAAALSAVLLLQIIMYQAKTKQVLEAERMKKAK